MSTSFEFTYCITVVHCQAFVFVQQPLKLLLLIEGIILNTPAVITVFKHTINVIHIFFLLSTFLLNWCLFPLSKSTIFNTVKLIYVREVEIKTSYSVLQVIY